MNRAHRVFAYAGALLVVIYVLLVPPGVGQWLLYDAIGLASAAAVFTGIVRNQPRRALPWALLGVGLTMFAAGDFVWGFYDNVLHRSAPVVSTADAFYLPAYVAFIGGCFLFARLRGERDADAAADGGIAGVGAAILVWAFVVKPNLGTDVGVAQQVVVAVYPILDIVLLTALVRLAFLPGKRSAPLWLAIAGFTLLLAGDLVYATLQLTGTYVVAGWLDTTWLLSYVALGTAALHPDMRELTERSHVSPRSNLGWARALLIGSGVLLGPLLWVFHAHGGAVAVTTLLLGAVVLWRIVLMTRSRDHAETRLAFVALHDPVTGLPNRSLLLDRIEMALARRVRSADGPISLLFLDLDRFKEVNDDLGHGAGDQLLAAVATRLQGAVRASDTVARFGGDEFVVLCDDLRSMDEGIVLAQRLCETFREPFFVVGRETYLTASVGVAFSDRREVTSRRLLHDADAAMYQAKDRGRGRVEIYDESMREESRSRLETANDLHHAVDRAELRLDYQPVIDLANEHVLGVEALVRWEHPVRGRLGPDQFIDIAESTGLIVPIGGWILHQAIWQAATWRARPGLEDLSIGVNVSALQLRDPEFVEVLSSVAALAGVPPDHVCIELTEAVLFDAVSGSDVAIERMSAAGFQIALDDFGTGYSPLSYLQRFPVNIVKIDRSFVMGLGRDPQSDAIVGAIAGLGRSLGMEVVAEGVETQEQLEMVRDFGCTSAQGYLFSRPVAAESLVFAPGPWVRQTPEPIFALATR